MNRAAEPRTAEILIIDDDPRNAKLFSRILEAEGHRTETAADGEKGLAAVAARKPDLLLLDVMMPGLDGYEVCRRLKAASDTRDVPILLVTALNDPEDKVRGLDAGADDFLTKPINRAELLARVRTHLRIKRLYDEVLESRESLARQNHKLLALEQMRADLTDMVVHDLKSPLSAMQLTLEFLQGLDEDRRRGRMDASLRHLSECTARLESLVANILDVARLEQTTIELCVARFSWKALAEHATDHFHAIAQEESKHLRIDLPAGDFDFVADPSMIERVLQNLVSNAVRFSGEGEEITVTIEPAPEGAALVTVADHGLGVPEEMRELIFDKFASLEARRKGKRANHGLGLTFCKLSVEAHGGHIWVESRPEGGSLFRFALPARVLARRPAVPAPIEAPVEAPEPALVGA